MQEEVTQKTMAFSIKSAKLTAQVLQAAARKFLEARNKGKTKLHHGQQSLLYECSNKSETDRPRSTSVRDRRRSIYCESDRQRRRERNRSQENSSAAPKRFEQSSDLKIKDFFISYEQTNGA